MAAVTKKCYYSNTSKIILFDFYSSSSDTHPDTSPTSDHAPKELRIMINISHVDLVCARTVSSPGDTAISEDTRYYIGELSF